MFFIFATVVTCEKSVVGVNTEKKKKRGEIREIWSS